MKRTLLRTAVFVLAAAVTFTATACSEFETRINRPGDDEPQFRVFFQVAPGEADGSVAGSIQLDDGQNTLNLNEIQLVVREMELGRDTGPCTDASPDDQEDDGDACEELTIAPRLLAVPVDQGSVALSTGPFPVEGGTYDRLEFDLQIATSEDGDIVGGNPQLAEESVLIRGAYNGAPFAATVDPERDFQLAFPQPIDTEAGEVSRVTLQVSLADWFRAEDGSLIDPRELESSPALEDRIEGQITSSFTMLLGPPQ